MVASLYIPEFEIENNYQLDKAFLPDGDIIAMDQVAKIKFDHTGTEAAAVTVIKMRPRSMPIKRPIIYSMVVDRPFLFLLKNDKLPINNEMLFMSKIEKL